jgi:hypothetical protein
MQRGAFGFDLTESEAPCVDFRFDLPRHAMACDLVSKVALALILCRRTLACH